MTVVGDLGGFGDDEAYRARTYVHKGRGWRQGGVIEYSEHGEQRSGTYVRTYIL